MHLNIQNQAARDLKGKSKNENIGPFYLKKSAPPLYHFPSIKL